MFAVKKILESSESWFRQEIGTETLKTEIENE
jgi:hypothetical protein